MLIVTLLYSLFTILGISSVLYPITNYCEVTQKKSEDNPRSQIEKELIENLNQTKGLPAKIKESIANFDKYYFSPLFIKDIDKIQRRSENQRTQLLDDREWKNNSIVRTDTEVRDQI